MTEPRTHGSVDALYAFAVGVWLALLQFSYYFMVEVYLSSRSTSFFISLFFWLVGFLIGLNLPCRTFVPLVVATPLAYCGALALLHQSPYRLLLLAAVAPSIAIGGMTAGAFFPHARQRFARVRPLLFHENNGFITGILLALLGATLHGRLLLTFVAPAGALPVLLYLLLAERSDSVGPRR